MTKYTHILFDADGTLFDYKRAETFAIKNSFACYNIVWQDIYLQEYARINRKIWQEFEQGAISGLELRSARFQRLFDVIAIQADAQQFGQTYLKQLSKADFLIEGALEVVAKLAHKCSLAIVTNGLTEVQRARFGGSPITKYFDAIVISDEIGVAKPAPAYFDYVFNALNFPKKENVIIVGDSLTSDIQGGFNYQIDTCWYNPAKLEYSLDQKPTFQIHNLEELLTF